MLKYLMSIVMQLIVGWSITLIIQGLVYTSLCQNSSANENEVVEHITKLEDLNPDIRVASINFLISKWDNNEVIATLESALQEARKNNKVNSIIGVSSILSKIEFRRSLGKELVDWLKKEIDYFETLDVSGRLNYFEKIISGSNYLKAWRDKLSDSSLNTQVVANEEDVLIGKLGKWFFDNLSKSDIKSHRRLIDALQGKLYIDLERESYTLFLKSKAIYYPRTTSSVRVLSKYLEFGDSELQLIVIEMLGNLKAAEYSGKIAEIMLKKHQENKDYKFVVITESCIKALANMGAKDQSKSLAELFPTMWGGQAAIALADLGASEYADEIAGELSELVEGVNIFRAELLIKALVKLNAVEYKKVIARFLDEPYTSNTAEAIKSLGKMRCREYLPIIAKFLKTQYKNWAIDAIADLKGEEYYEEIKSFLYDNEESTRISVVKAIGAIGDKKYARDIFPLLKDKSPLMKILAIKTLDILNAKEYLTEIETMLDDDEMYEKPGSFGLPHKITVSEIARRTLVKWKYEGCK
ncbi:MAG: HEAT repeat domain-containing protein [Planctomycetes bacterium]|nr:HEAT repeat domain-containing protein [Planctomycetota bacterium]